MPYLGVKPADEFTSKDLNGEQLILDADADTTITADTDDQIDIRIAGADDFQFTANTFTAQSGSTIVGHLNATGDTSSGDNAAIGYTAAEGLILTGQGSTNDITIKRDDDTAVLEVATGQSDIEVTGGNILFGTADKGVYLGVTSATAANLLNDYEVGTFTANLTFGGSTTGLTYNSVGQAGRYVKVGGLVFVYIYVGLTDKGSDAGAIKIVGLPFTSKANSGQNLSAVINIGYGTGGWDLTADHIITGGLGENSVIISLMQGRYDTDTNPANLTGGMATDDSQIYASMTYETAG